MMSTGRELRPTGWLRAVLSDPARARYLPTMHPHELRFLERVLDPVVDEVQAVQRRFTVLPMDPLVPVSLIVCIGNQDQSPAAIALQSAMALWTIALDDLLDSGDLSEADAAAVLRQCRLAASASSPRPSTDLGAAMAWFQSALARYPLWNELRPSWHRSLQAFLGSAGVEFRMSRALAAFSGEPTALKRYVFHGSRSIGLPWLLITGLALRRDESAVGVLPHLVALADKCGTAVRLANDLAGAHREADEGTINAVAVLAEELKAQGLSATEAFEIGSRRVESMLKRALRQVHKLVMQAKTDSGVESQFARFTEFSVEFQRKGDIRHLAVEPLAAVFSEQTVA